MNIVERNYNPVPHLLTSRISNFKFHSFDPQTKSPLGQADAGREESGSRGQGLPPSTRYTACSSVVFAADFLPIGLPVVRQQSSRRGSANLISGRVCKEARGRSKKISLEVLRVGFYVLLGRYVNSKPPEVLKIRGPIWRKRSCWLLERFDLIVK
ncbi:hypothetical protein Agabi119p4_7003 [Agaricus bisporus var. burnettii]|uniref:Uncharacterized protein n=1 Tax=Agaricus bisporus var. burnettii TaxID=192524 RepID=A0A8H7F0K1_AGABI|nr:hypothetical protein Agabi119p4_7003 [Agaricus bisporus var. burnettii]